MGLFKIETTDKQDLATDKIKELLGENTRTKGMKKFLDLVADGKIGVIIK